MENWAHTTRGSVMFERFTPSARQAVSRARTAARSLGHQSLGTEHLLLGILEEADGAGAKVLAELEADPATIRREVEFRTGPESGPAPARLPFSPQCKKALEFALREAKQLGYDDIGTEHLLLGIARVDEGVAAQILLDCFGIDRGQIRDRLVVMVNTQAWGPRVRRTRPFLRPPVHFALPRDAAAGARRRRIVSEIQSVLDENDRLRRLLREHGIDPDARPGSAGESA